MTAPAAVRLIGDPVPRTRAAEVGDVSDPQFRRDGEVLTATLGDFRGRHGFGRAIAAPQIGIPRRFIVVDLGDGPFLVIDPVITTRSEKTFTMWDDCMSVPWLLVRLRRHRSVSLEYTDREGRRQSWQDVEVATSELMQHEVDHLDGVLLVDRAEDAGAMVAREVFERDPDRFRAEVDYTIAG